jgi:hypothetical protein
MIEHLMSSSSGDYQGCAAGFIRLLVRGLRSQQASMSSGRIVAYPEVDMASGSCELGSKSA